MTSSVRKTSFTIGLDIGMVVCQGSLMTHVNLMSLGYRQFHGCRSNEFLSLPPSKLLRLISFNFFFVAGCLLVTVNGSPGGVYGYQFQGKVILDFYSVKCLVR
jgi:hypothetical protein